MPGAVVRKLLDWRGNGMDVCPADSIRRGVPTIPKPGVAKMKVVPLGDKVAVKRLEAEETTAGGIVLPGSAQEKPRQGRVLSVGDGRLLSDGTRTAHQVREGDRVLFSQYAG